MFKNKYKATLLNSKWEILKSRLTFEVLPRKDEYIYVDGLYFLVINLVHDYNESKIFIIVEEFKHQIEKKT